MLSNKETAKLLYEASNILEEKQWCKGSLGRVGYDRLIVDRDDSALYSDHATHLCMEGSIYVAAGKFAVPEVREVLGMYMRKRGKVMDYFNDCVAKTKADALTEMRTFALELLEQDQPQVAA
jgi:hypothetical protein